MMRVTTAACVALAIAFGAALLSAQAPAAQAGRGGPPAPNIVLAPKATAPAGWVSPNKPWTKLPEVLAKHVGQTDWTEAIVSDELLHADYISMGPGKKTARRMNADTREWWIIQDGQAKFTIEGQEPFVASKGWLVQVPYRLVYQIETVGDKPSLRFEVNIANATKMYPLDETPVPVPGKEFLPVRVQGAKGTYDDLNKPYFDFNDYVSGKVTRAGAFVTDVRGFANMIAGRPQAAPAPTDKGHFHEESGEFWFIIWGKVRYTLQTQETFIADQGDVVYAPKQMWHLASLAGDGPISCRVAMNGYPDLAHSFEPPAATAGRGRGQ
jgi:mannose-6-phosphate isomerase-like protein (cupin superfamily)